MELLRKPPLFVLLVGILATGSLLVLMRASAQAQVPRPQVDVLSEASPDGSPGHASGCRDQYR